jgi:hypothetical protein
MSPLVAEYRVLIERPAPKAASAPVVEPVSFYISSSRWHYDAILVTPETNTKKY